MEQILEVTMNQDGSMTRHVRDPRVTATEDQLPWDSEEPALSKDVPLDHSLGTFIRIFRPIATASSSSSLGSKLPIILYFHGGGFIHMSAASTIFHNFCAKMSADLSALVLSVDYRLAPEHRLPAAYHDAANALAWVRNQVHHPTETWLRQADFSTFFIMGNSSGGNIAFHLAIRAKEMPDLSPIKVCWLILDQPGFNGEERTESELRLANDNVLPLVTRDSVYKLALPVGANRDHEFSNPIKMKGQLKGLPKCYIIGCFGDPMIDRHRALANMLQEEGVRVTTKFDMGGFHGVYVLDPDKTAALLDGIKSFVNGHYI